MRAGIRVTTVARTLVDLAGVMDPHALEVALEWGLRSRHASFKHITAALERAGPTIAGRTILRSLIREHSGVATESAFEALLYRRLLDFGLPRPVRQYVITDDGRFVARPDFAYPEAKLVIEADSFRFHSRQSDLRRDRRRQNHLAKLGWAVYGVTWEDLKRRPKSVCRQIAELRTSRLRPQGPTGPLR
ncbi:MAG: endonuclease domain-containing protein [Actinomycetota bacterium]